MLSFLNNLARTLGSENCPHCGKFDITYGVILGKDGIEGKCIYCDKPVKKYSQINSLIFSLKVFNELAINRNEVKASSAKIANDAIASLLNPLLLTNKIPAVETITQFQRFFKSPEEVNFGGQEIGGFVKLTKGVPSVTIINNATPDQVLGLFASTTAINYLLRFKEEVSPKSPSRHFSSEFDSTEDNTSDEEKIATISIYFNKLLKQNKNIFGKTKSEVTDRLNRWLSSNPQSIVTYKIKNKLQITVNELPTDMNIQTLADIYTLYPELLDPFKQVLSSIGKSKQQEKYQESIKITNTPASDPLDREKKQELIDAVMSLPTNVQQSLFSKTEAMNNKLQEDFRQAVENGFDDVVDMFLQSGIDVNYPGMHGNSPLHWATMKGHKRITEKLILKGASINVKNLTYKYTPLHWTSIQGNAEVAKLLIGHGADIYAKDKDGNTPLHYSALHGHIDIVKILLEKGADIHAQDNEGVTPIDLGNISGHKEIVKILLAENTSTKISQPKKSNMPNPDKENPLGKLVESQFKYLAIDGKSLNLRQYFQAFYKMVLKERTDHKFAVSQVMEVPSLILQAIQNNTEVAIYLKPYKPEISSAEKLFEDFDNTSKYLIDDDVLPAENTSTLDFIRTKAREFIQEFDETNFIDKLTKINQFIKNNTAYVKNILERKGLNNQGINDYSDTIFMVAASKFRDLTNECNNDIQKRKMVFIEKVDNGFGKTMWDEYSYLLINYAKWPMTSDAKGLWSISILEFGQLKNKK